MLFFWLVLLIVAVSLVVFLWVGTLFFQRYIYTEPTRGLYWQAPAAGAVMGLFFAGWCLLVATTPGVTPTDNPY
ncbi:MAG: hypothetical protein NZO58_08575, partial [Gemmataceae bacterium]|nr:hypothetical protein [Gemmataceae bacterium]